ncbi:MAG: hypothetical protein QOD35_3174 [Nocardioidaceae bacterium]|nr:hypothetical protein [Nocardioidaceae bacterium]
MTSAADDAEMSTSQEPVNVVQRILRWLRAGYPEGVPQQDYVALLGILRRTLTPIEMSRVVDELVADAASGDQALTGDLVQQRISDVVKGAVDERDVERVSARLAAVGWPLGSPVEAAVELNGNGARTGLVTRVVEWLRSEYPTGLPERDYIPLLALLRRRLSDEEVSEISRLLLREAVQPGDRVGIGSAIAQVTSELPSEEDIERVRAHLVAHGWPVEFDL